MVFVVLFAPASSNDLLATTTKDVGGVIRRNTDEICITIAGVTVSIRGLIVVVLISGRSFHFLTVLILARAVLQVSATVLAPAARLDASLAI